MMNKILTTLTVLTFVALTVSPAFAVEVTPSPKPTGFRREIRQERRDVKADIKEIKTEARTTIRNTKDELRTTSTQTRLEFNQKKIQAVYQGMVNAFTRRLDSLKSYQTRIQTRLDTKKVKLPGNQNLTDAQVKLDNVTNSQIPKFNTDLDAFKAQMVLISTSTNPKSLVPELKALAKTVEQDLKNIRTELVAALRLVVKAK